MPGTCDDCGGDVEWKNAAGHFRDVCQSCAQSVADEREPDPDLQGVDPDE